MLKECELLLLPLLVYSFYLGANAKVVSPPSEISLAFR